MAALPSSWACAEAMEPSDSIEHRVRQNIINVERLMESSTEAGGRRTSRTTQ